MRVHVGWLVLAVLIAIVAIVAFGLQRREIDGLEERLEVSRAGRAAACDQARSAALHALHGDIARVRNRGGDPAGAGSALAVYVRACAEPGDVETLDVAKLLAQEVFFLFQQNALDELSALEARLSASPLAEWKTVVDR